MKRKKPMKLPNSFGGIIFLGDRRRKPYAARVTVGWSQDKKQQYKYLGYFEKYTDAMQCLIEYNQNPYNVDGKKITLIELWNDWLKIHSTKITRGSLNVYKSTFRKMEPLYNKKVHELRTFHLQDLINNCDSYSVARRIKILSSMLFQDAMKKDIVNKDYSQFLELPKNDNKKKKTPFTFDEIKIIESNEGDRIADMLIILLYTGMRVGELLEIKSSNINLEQRVMVGGLKTEYGKNRTIPIHKRIVPIIERYIGHEFLFSAPRGGMYHYCNEGTKINKYIKSLGFSQTSHECRHTFISQCERLGFEKLIVKRIVGHSTKDITDHYTHFKNSDLVSTIDRFKY